MAINSDDTVKRFGYFDSSRRWKWANEKQKPIYRSQKLRNNILVSI